MTNEKERYEQLISHSTLFSLDSNSEPSAYQREQLRLIENLYCYLMSIRRDKYENYGLEITETAKRCIRSYDKSKGQFLTYFLSAWKQEYSHITSDQVLDEKLHGIKISEDDKRNVVRYIKLVNSMSGNLSPKEIYKRLSDSMGLTIADVERIASIEETTVSSDITADSEGNELSLWDQFESEDILFDEIGGAEDVTTWLKEIDSVFARIQERQKRIVSDLLTVRLCQQLPYQVLKHFQCNFLNYDIIETWYTTGEIPSQKAIAEKHGKREASVSRTLREFCKKIGYIQTRD